MLVPAVQGYAQGPRREGGHGHSSSRSAPARSHSAPSRSSTPSRSYSAPSRSSAPRQSYSTPSRSTAPRQSYSTPSRSTSRPSVTTQPRSSTPRQSATAPTRTAPQRQGVTTTPRNSAPRHEAPRHNRPTPPPPPRHHSGHNHHHHGYLSHGHHHHHHHCIWDSWRYYSYGGYHNRFICHSYYRDRYFDSLLGYYLYGSFDRPTRLEIGGLSLEKYNGQLQIRNGSSYSYMSLWQNQSVSYTSSYTTVSITTGNGQAIIYFYDSYGNEATYVL
ncbi:MAG: hypothetical protein IJE43_25170 [Alphaproteobacteria bacterium]|nr:hypothetical protein [Alphaproteobacteria bacterium]